MPPDPPGCRGARLEFAYFMLSCEREVCAGCCGCGPKSRERRYRASCPVRKPAPWACGPCWHGVPNQATARTVQCHVSMIVRPARPRSTLASGATTAGRMNRNASAKPFFTSRTSVSVPSRLVFERRTWIGIAPSSATAGPVGTPPYRRRRCGVAAVPCAGCRVPAPRCARALRPGRRAPARRARVGLIMLREFPN